MTIGGCLDNPPADILANVNSVSNSDGTLTISPTTGAVIASIALGNANSWNSVQTFQAINVTSSTAATNGLYLSAANTVSVACNSTRVASFTSTGLNNTVIGATTAAAGTFTSVTASADITCGAGNSFIISGKSKINTGSDGNFVFQNNSGNDFGRLMLGGNTSSFPALKRSAATLQARLGDDSTYADISVRAIIPVATAVASLPASPVEGMRASVTDSNAVSFTAGIGSVVAAGGSTHVPVYYDGTNWRIG